MRTHEGDLNRHISCIGEVLWDAMPEGLFLGGAPLNVCSHLAMLGEKAVMVSRVGDDRLGKEALRRVERVGIPTGPIQRDQRHETGLVEVDLTRKEGPGYRIIEPVAWDFISLESSAAKTAEQSDIVIFGTLAQRNEVSRKTIRHFISSGALKIYDINLRPPFDDREIVKSSLERTDIVKLNDEELLKLAGWWDYDTALRPAAEQLVEDFGCSRICITRGGNGALLYNGKSWTEQKGMRVEVMNTVGAGDAFLAGLVYGLERYDNDSDRLAFANLLGGYVATKQSAIPEYNIDDIAAFAKEQGAGVKIG